MPQEMQSEDPDRVASEGFDGGDEKGDRHGPVTIYVNMESKQFAGRRIAFEQVVQLASGLAHGPDVIYVVAYSKGSAQQRAGSLVAGQTTRVINGMVFSVTVTIRS